MDDRKALAARNKRSKVAGCVGSACSQSARIAHNSLQLSGEKTVARDCIHASADGAEATYASLDGDRLTQCVGGDATQPIFSMVFENQLDGRAQALAALSQRAALYVGPGSLHRPSDEPFTFALGYGCEFIPYGTSIGRSE